MVVIGFNGGRMRGAGFNIDIIALNCCMDTHTGKIFHDRSHAVTFLKTDMADAADKSRTVGKWRNSSHGQSLVGKAAHIDIDAVESVLCRTGQADTFRCILSTAAHFLEGAKQCHISLQGIKVNVSDKDIAAGEDSHAVEIGGS